MATTSKFYETIDEIYIVSTHMVNSKIEEFTKLKILITNNQSSLLSTYLKSIIK